MRAVVLLLIMLASSSAQAQPLPDDPGDRFSYNAVGDGVLRLDLRTGAVSLCVRSTAGWTCRAVPDERAALETEIARLQNDNAALKKTLADRGLPLPGGQATGAPLSRDPSGSLDRPNAAEMSRLMAGMEKAWQRLVDLMASLRADRQKQTP